MCAVFVINSRIESLPLPLPKCVQPLPRWHTIYQPIMRICPVENNYGVLAGRACDGNALPLHFRSQYDDYESTDPNSRSSCQCYIDACYFERVYW